MIADPFHTAGGQYEPQAGFLVGHKGCEIQIYLVVEPIEGADGALTFHVKQGIGAGSHEALLGSFRVTPAQVTDEPEEVE